MTRRLLVILALGSTIGAGGIGAYSGAGAGDGADIIGATDPAQPLQPASQPASQPLSQPPLSQRRLPKSFFNNPPHFFVPQPLSQPESQPPQGAAVSHPQAGSAQPQDGAAQPLSQPPQLFLQLNSLPIKPPRDLLPQPQAGVASQPPQGAATSQPHAGSAHPPHDGVPQPLPRSLPSNPQPLASQPQVGSAHPPHAGWAQPPSQEAVPQPQPLPRSLPSSPQPLASQPQAGSHDEPHPSPQAGAPQPQASAPQAGSAQLVSQQLLFDPQPFMPSMRSSRSKPKLWLQIELPTTRVKVRIVLFIGATSPKRNLAVMFSRCFESSQHAISRH